PKAPHKRCECPDIDPICTYGDQMGSYPVQFTDQCADVFYTFRYFLVYTKHTLHAHDKGMAIVHGGQIVQPVRKRNRLCVVDRFSVLVKATMQIAQMRNDRFDQFAIRDQLQAQYTMRRWVLWPHVDDH